MTPTTYFISRTRQSYTKSITGSERTLKLKALSLPAWDVSGRSQADVHCERHLRNFSEISQKTWHFRDVFKTSQIHLKKDVFFVTFLRRLYISKRMSISWRVWDVSKASFPSICDFSKIRQKYGFMWFLKGY